MAIDRSKFKPTPVTKMQEKDKELESALGKKGNRAGMLGFDEGKNIFRIFPAHPDTDGQFTQPSVKVFLPMMVDEKDQQGKATGGRKESSKPIFNSRIHGGTPKDLVEEYIKLARKIAESEIEDKGDRQKYLDKVYGKYSKIASERVQGINYKTSYVLYANKIVGETHTFGRLEIGTSIKNAINQISATEAGDEPMGTDAFTDLETGRALVVHYNSKSTTPAGYYVCSLHSEEEKATGRLKRFPITEEQLIEFEKQPTLMSMYVDVFKRKDFLLQVEGLEFFDAKEKMGICDRDEWAELVNEIEAYYSEDEGVEEPEVDEIPEVDDEEKDEDQYSLMSRVELKALNVKAKLNIVVKQSMTDDTLRDLVRAGMKEKEIPHIPLPGEKEEPAAPKKGGSALDRLKKLGAK